MRRKLISQKFNFIYGEIDPTVESRADYEALQNHLREGKNVYATESGALFNRAGKRFLADLQTELGVSGPFALFSFNSTRNIKYLLVFYGGGFAPFDLESFDFIRLEDGSPLKISAPYLAKDLFDLKGIKRLRSKQSANVLYLAHEDYPFAQVKYYARETWTYNAVAFNNGPWKEFNTNKGRLIEASGVSGNITLTSAAENPAADLALQPYQLASGESVKSIVWTIGENEGPALENLPDLNVNAEMAVSYLLRANTDLQAQGNVSAQTVTAASNTVNYSGKAISCTIKVLNAQTLEETVFTMNSAFTQTGGQGLPFFTEDMQGQYIQLKYFDAATKGWSMDSEGYALNDVVKSGENYYKVTSGAGKAGYSQPKHTEGTVSDGRLMFKYLHSGFGRALITEYVSPYKVKALVIDYMPDKIKTYKWRLGLVDGVTYPNCVDFIDGRLAFSYNSAEGPCICLSQSDDYLNFSDFNYGIVDAECSIKMIIQSEFARINWIKRIGAALVAGTDNGLVRLYAPDDGVITNTNITAPFIATAAASAVLPADADGNIIYVSKDRQNLYLSQYNFQTNAYLKNDLLKLAKYQFKEKISDVFPLEHPYNALSIRMQSGAHRILFLDINEGTKGAFLNDTLGLALGDAVMNFDKDGDESGLAGVYGGRWLAFEEMRDVYDKTNSRPPLEFYSPLTVTPDGEEKYVKELTLPQKMFAPPAGRALTGVYGKYSFKISAAPGAKADISALKIPFDAALKAFAGVDIDVKAVLVPKYPGAEEKDGVNAVKNVFQVFNTQDFYYGEDENNMRALSEALPEKDSSFYCGELETSMPSASRMRALGREEKLLSNAPEIIIKNAGAKNFCLCGILTYE